MKNSTWLECVEMIHNQPTDATTHVTERRLPVDAADPVHLSTPYTVYNTIACSMYISNIIF